MAENGEQQNLPKSDDQQSPDELGKMVETLLESMQSKFQLMSEQIIGRLDEMGSRVDDLEKNISELMEQLDAKDNPSIKKEQK